MLTALLSRLALPLPLGIPWRLVVVVVLVASAAGLGYVEGLTHEQVRSAHVPRAQVADAGAAGGGRAAAAGLMARPEMSGRAKLPGRGRAGEG